MNKFIITEEEKSRILGMHKTRTSKHYLLEQEVDYDDTQKRIAYEKEAIRDFELYREYYLNSTADKIRKDLDQWKIKPGEEGYNVYEGQGNPNLIPYIKQVVQNRSGGKIKFNPEELVPKN